MFVTQHGVSRIFLDTPTAEWNPTMVARKTKNASTAVDVKLGKLRSDITAIQSDMRKAVADGEGVVNAHAQAALRAAESAAERALRLAEDTAANWADDVETWTNDNLDSARESVRAQPISAMLLSLGVGALLGAIFLRR
jgi:ElaB/YqjD/DUF883 family membrane-anchored ribosome-binding protein